MPTEARPRPGRASASARASGWAWVLGCSQNNFKTTSKQFQNNLKQLRFVIVLPPTGVSKRRFPRLSHLFQGRDATKQLRFVVVLSLFRACFGLVWGLFWGPLGPLGCAEAVAAAAASELPLCGECRSRPVRGLSALEAQKRKAGPSGGPGGASLGTDEGRGARAGGKRRGRGSEEERDSARRGRRGRETGERVRQGGRRDR